MKIKEPFLQQRDRITVKELQAGRIVKHGEHYYFITKETTSEHNIKVVNIKTGDTYWWVKNTEIDKVIYGYFQITTDPTDV